MSVTARGGELHDVVARTLAERGVRYTKGRRSVVASIQISTGPRTAAELGENVGRDVPVSSLYRTLSILEDALIVKKHHGADGVARYELAEGLVEHHHHVVCIACGRIEDVSVTTENEGILRGIVETVGADAGYRVVDHVLEVEGVCRECDRR